MIDQWFPNRGKHIPDQRVGYVSRSGGVHKKIKLFLDNCSKLGVGQKKYLQN